MTRERDPVVNVQCIVCWEYGDFRYAPGMGYVCSGCRQQAREREPYWWDEGRE